MRLPFPSRLEVMPPDHGTRSPITTISGWGHHQHAATWGYEGLVDVVADPTADAQAVEPVQQRDGLLDHLSVHAQAGAVLGVPTDDDRLPRWPMPVQQFLSTHVLSCRHGALRDK